MNPILVESTRGKVLESFHRGVVCVVDAQNKIVFSAGDVNQICYPRSAMKLFQVIPFVVNGGIEKFKITHEELAVMCGSHNAEEAHVNAVNSILTKIGLNHSHLQCGAQTPSAKHIAHGLIRNQIKPTAIHNNCSGKHAGMLAACMLMNWPVENYLEPTHPLQLAIKNVCSILYEYPEANMETALDGCSAPIFSVPVFNQAIGYKNLIGGYNLPAQIQFACNTIINAIAQFPFMVAGSKRFCTDLMQITAPEIIGKTGADGIFCLSIKPLGLGVCIKIDDGKMLPQYNIAQAIVNQSGLFTTEQLAPLQGYLQAPIKNYNQWVSGEFRVNANFLNSLEKALGFN